MQCEKIINLVNIQNQEFLTLEWHVINAKEEKPSFHFWINPKSCENIKKGRMLNQQKNWGNSCLRNSKGTGETQTGNDKKRHALYFLTNKKGKEKR